MLEIFRSYTRKTVVHSLCYSTMQLKYSNESPLGTLTLLIDAFSIFGNDFSGNFPENCYKKSFADPRFLDTQLEFSNQDLFNEELILPTELHSPRDSIPRSMRFFNPEEYKTEDAKESLIENDYSIACATMYNECEDLISYQHNDSNNPFSNFWHNENDGKGICSNFLTSDLEEDEFSMLDQPSLPQLENSQESDFEMTKHSDRPYMTEKNFGYDNCMTISPDLISSPQKSSSPVGLKHEQEIHCNKNDVLSTTPSPSKTMKGSKNKILFHRDFSYEGTEIETSVSLSTRLINVARNEQPPNINEKLRRKLVDLRPEQDICNIIRVRYLRTNLDSIKDIYENVGYEENLRFDINRPYEPQYVRYEVDPTNKLPFNETRCGLCPYCPELNFKNLKTSTYSQHLALTHGVYTDNFLTPNPLYYGLYVIKKNNLRRKTIAHEHQRFGVVCPACYDVVGTECSIKTASSKPLNNYMRHFKEKHRQSKDKMNPVLYFNKMAYSS